MLGLVAILLFFGVPAYLVKRRYDYKELLLADRSSSTELLELREQHHLLIDRVSQLEDTLSHADYELNTKLARLELKAKNPDPPPE